ncbi:RNA-binding protein [bacterium F11]|nr:RNA-binding protein [bacterium F11]
MSKRLYVGNLPFSMMEDQLHDLFTANGQVVSTKLITDKFSGQSKGFGFVEMASEEDAAAAIAKLHNYEADGRKLVVNEARPMEKREGGGGGGGRNRNRGHSGGGGGGGGYKRW